MMSDTIETITLQSPVSLVPEKPVEKRLTREKVNILWTGGFDSTFRMLQLSKMEVDVQPYYLCDKRKSEKNELKAISAITRDIIDHPETKCFIHPLAKINVSEIEPDLSITEAYKKLYANTLLGSQYDWLARFANSVPGLELSLEKSITSKAYICLWNYGKLLKIKNKETTYYVVDRENSSADLIKVFGNFRLPYPLYDITKLEMTEDYKELGFEHTMSTTWFCHTPIRNKPCGVCNPCKAVIGEGLTFRMPLSALKRHERLKKYGEHSLIGWHYKLHLKMGQLKAGAFSLLKFLRIQ